MTDLPKGWIEVSLKEITKVNWGNTSITKKQYIPHGFQAFSAAGQDGYLKDFEYEGPAIILSAIGARCGKCFYTEGKWTAIKNTIVIQGNAKFINHRLLFHFLNDENKWKISGAAQPFITMATANEKLFPLPPLNEQKRIVAKLDKLLAKVDVAKARLDKIPQTLKRFRQSVLSAAVSGELTKDWREKNNIEDDTSNRLGKLKDSIINSNYSKREKDKYLKFYNYATKLEFDDDYELPNKWIKCFIGNIGVVSNGSTPSRKRSDFWNGTINWVSSGEVQNNIVQSTREKITPLGYKNSSVKLLPKNTLLLAMIGEGKTRGQSSILSIESTINQNIAAVEINNDFILSEYLFIWFRFRYEKNRTVGSGSGPQALNCERVRELLFYYPPLEEQKEIVRRVEELFKFADQIEARYNKAKEYVDKLTQSILAKVFRGELVPQDPNDEPADKLLERIKAEKENTANKRAVGSGNATASTKTKRPQRKK